MKRVLFFVWLVSLAQLSAAQAPSRLTFKEAVKIGLEKNLALNQAKNNLVSTSVAKTSNMLQMAPSVNIQGNAGRNDGNSFNQQEGKVVNGVLDFFSVNVNASMPLFNGLNSVNTFRQSVHQNEAQLQLVHRTSQDVIRNVANQYLQCLLDRQLAVIQEKNVETQKQQYNQIKEQVNAGSRAEVDLYNQEYQVKNAELLYLRAMNTLNNDKAQLAIILQLDPTVQFDLEEPSWDINQIDVQMKSLEELKTTALTQRSDLSQAKSTRKASQLGFYATRGTYLPIVSAFAQYGSRYNYIKPTPEFNPENRSFNDQFFEDNTQLTYGVSFTVPIFGGFQNRLSVVRSKVAYENAKLTTENTENTVKSEVLLAYQNYTTAKTSFEASESQLKAAEISYSLEKERYNLGIADIVALTLATQNYTRAQADAASARYTLMFQQVLVNYATGTLKFEDIP
jgi:outer membrane protein